MQYGNNSMTVAQVRQEVSTVFLAKVFNWMAVGLGLTGVTAFVTSQTVLARMVMGTPLVFCFDDCGDRTANLPAGQDQQTFSE